MRKAQVEILIYVFVCLDSQDRRDLKLFLWKRNFSNNRDLVMVQGKWLN